MRQINSEWESLPKVKKGNIGEYLVREYLEAKGWIIYEPITKGAHYFDKLATKNKDKVIALDVKTKARLNKWNATGIDLRHYKEYINFVKKTSIPFYLVFVDDKTGNVYSQEITKLKNPIKVNNFIIAWNLEQMKLLFNIGKEKIKELEKFDTRNYKFNPIN